MTNFPVSLDDDTTLPCVNDNITEIGAEAINALRDAVFSIETEMGIGGSGTAGSIADRLGVSINPDGSVKPSALTALGLVTLPITNSQISTTAAIPESKLNLDYATSDLYNYLLDLSREVKEDTGWISTSGTKLDPHIAGFSFNHKLSHINVGGASEYFKNKFASIVSPTYTSDLRDYTNSYTTLKELNDEFLYHQFADGTGSSVGNITTNGGATYPSIYGHTASGIFLDTSRFATIPQTAEDLQQFAEFVDSSSLLLLGSRLQNLFSNGVSRESRSSILSSDNYGQAIIPTTTVTTYFLGASGTGSAPVDNINNGDDIVEFIPTGSPVTTKLFESQFSLVKIGDIIRVNYGTVEVAFRVKEKKFISSGSNKYIIRIDGKNILYSTTATARIDRALINNNKYGVLAVSAANNAAGVIPSLIVSSPRGAQALGLGFNPDQFDSAHYMLYLALFPTGIPSDGYTILPGIDVTGNRGITPGKYTLESVIEATNNAFRQVGFNYRFNAFSYLGEFGICLSDSCGNAGFSILNAVVSSVGVLDQTETQLAFPNNVIDMFPVATFTAPDPLGFGPFGANIASPPYMTSYGSTEAAINPTKLYVPLRKNNFYTNGVEKERLSLDVGQIIDNNGGGYWVAKIQALNDIPGVRLQTTYRVYLDLSTSGLKPGKTLVVQSYGAGTLVDFGRFIIESISFGGGCGVGTAFGFTDITVYDSIHAEGFYDNVNLGLDGYVALHFDSGSVSFNTESATDFAVYTPFKRYFEVYVDENGKTFTHERGRVNISGSTLTVNSIDVYTYTELAKLDIIKISPTLRGYEFGTVNKITLRINNYISDIFDGYLCSFDGTSCTQLGPLTYGKKGDVVRFYDETNTDYIDIIFDINTTIADFTVQYLDFQLFPTLSLDNEIMLIGTCQLNDTSKLISQLRDERQFGNISEKDLTTSALNFISMPERLLHGNGVIRGFDLDSSLNPNNQQIYLTGGLVLVNGALLEINDQTVTIPLVQEYINPATYNINWIICVNDKSEYQPIVLLDYDATLGTPNTPNRIVKVYSYSGGAMYNVEGTTFSNLINKRKDLTPLYIVAASVVAGPVLSLVVTDVRKFVNDGDTNLPLKLTTSTSQGNFRDPEAILNWIKYNNAYNAHAIVKGADSTSGLIQSAITFDFDNTVLIEGQNNATLKFSATSPSLAPVIIGSNITFKDLDLEFVDGISSTSTVNNVMFDNCNITIRLLGGVDSIFNITSGDNIIFKDCSFTITSQHSDSGGCVFKLTDVTNFQFLNSSLYLGSGFGSGQYPRNIFVLDNCTGFTVSDSDFSGYFVRCISDGYAGTCSNSLKCINTTITSLFRVNPAVPVVGITYDTLDQVNSGQGYIYMNVAKTTLDVDIDNVTFNYSPDVVDDDRFSFINIEFSNQNAILNNLRITNCKFNHLNLDSSFDDVRAAISIINTINGLYLSTTQQPILMNAKISNNYGNRNQSIIITSVKNANSSYGVVGNMIYPGLVAQDCVVENNICGIIGYWTAASAKVAIVPPNVTTYSDKSSGLVIKNNSCHYIGNLDNRGYYFYVSYPDPDTSVMYNVSNYPSGFVTIENNTCNWIHVGESHYSNGAYVNASSLQILNNILYAYNSSWLSIIYDSIPSYLVAFTTSAISVRSNVYDSSIVDDMSVLISGNITNIGNWLDSTSISPMLSTYYYNSYVVTYCSATITDNIFRGINAGGGLLNQLIVLGGYRSIVTNNQIFRSGNDINYYIAFWNPEVVYYTPNWNGLNANGIIKNNIFDSPYIDAALSENVIKLSYTGEHWTVTDNINQTVYVHIPITNSQLYYNSGFGYSGMITGTSFYVGMAPGLSSDSYIGYKSQVLRIYDDDTPALRHLGWQENIDKYLPVGASIINVKMGVKCLGVVDTSDTKIKLYLNKYIKETISATYTNLDYFTIFPVPDGSGTTHSAGENDTSIISDSSSTDNAELTGTQLNTTINTQYLLITPSAISYVVGKNYSFGVSLDINYKANPKPVNFYFSPLCIKYRW